MQLLELKSSCDCIVIYFLKDKSCGVSTPGIMGNSGNMGCCCNINASMACSVVPDNQTINSSRFCFMLCFFLTSLQKIPGEEHNIRKSNISMLLPDLIFPGVGGRGCC